MDANQALINKVYRFFRGHLRFRRVFAATLAACLLCIDTEGGLSVHSFTAPLVTMLILCWPTALLPSLARHAVQILLGEVVIAVCLVDCYCQLFLGNAITPQIWTTIVQTDGREAGEFFATYVGEYVFRKWRIQLLLALAVLLPASFVPMLCRPVERWLVGLKWNHRPWRIAALAVVLVAVVLEVVPTVHYLKLFDPRADQTDTEGLVFRKYHRSVPTPLHRLVFAMHATAQSGRTLEGVRAATLAAQVDSVEPLAPRIVLVVGESYNKHHASLYGYPLPTTPRQERRRDAGELTVFTDVVSPWNITSSVMLHLFSVNPRGGAKRVGECPLFPMLFRRAGYRVSFFSNQFNLRGLFRGATNQMGHFFLADHRLSDTLFDYRHPRSVHYDMRLVRALDDWRRENPCEGPTLDIVHLVGQHFDYKERYPAGEARFGTADYRSRRLGAEAEATVMHYDNSVYYNDRVMDSLLTLYEGEEAVVIYVSDHGDEVYDELPVQGRQFHQPGRVEARNEFEVPMWIWCSPLFRERHPEVVERIRAAADRPLMSDNLSQTLLYFGGIGSAWTDEAQNVLSPAYRGKPRIIAGAVDYDWL